MLKQIYNQTKNITVHLIEESGIKPKEILVLGCSTSKVGGHNIGSNSSLQVAESIFSAVYPLLKNANIYLAVQCCEHLNRAIVIEQVAAEIYNLQPVNAVPHAKAGGAMASYAYNNMSCPVVVEHIKAHAGIDIGSTLIGMHLREVAVPLHFEPNLIGDAIVVCAKTRLKYIGGERACYTD